MRQARLRAALGAAALLVFATSCGGGDSTGPGSGPSTTNQITVRDNSFSPASTTVAAGTTVTWTWAGSATHDVWFSAGDHSPAQSRGTYTREFSTPGTYDYICSIHGSAMSGRIVVN